MSQRNFLFTLISILFFTGTLFCQEKGNSGMRILLQGLTLDATTLAPVANSQISINKSFSSVSGYDGTFSIFVSRSDTVIFTRLGYKSTTMYVSDTLSGNEFITGIYMHTDTLAIGEVIIIPSFRNLKSEIMNAGSKTPSTFDNAKYNVAISAYAGRTTQGSLGSPSANYEALRQKQKTEAYERGGIPSDKILGLSPLLLIPAAYLLLNGIPEKPAAFKPDLSNHELDILNARYLETLKQKK
jgi:hypothetical protein